ncbi:nuclear transport factor 2 family protein [Dyella silvatica]|uniref:nuclear transport factor 2 family protein n=1 Tax=Dyella silvatica TaxID=2992128 RepID=UPI002259898B|nr:nuclear transport factor 2 family protein [Dyella silvatica]
MKQILLASLVMAATMGLAHAGSPPANPAAAKVQIEQLVDAFKAAIIAKDGATLSAMFLPGGAWISVYDDETYRHIKTKRPEAPRLMPDDYKKFADFVSKSPKPIEEKFSDVRIETDGTVATVYFDYRFLLDGKQTNQGSETWQLVNTGDAWKINAMLYSIKLDPSVFQQAKP